ncbi:M56 family metallopeptidase [Longispora sp. K20-0274]|uniref:M56 family metallopeptidase n=1 Tax=Longispora sp. K20-0274 TaxID=3088255 RepID=UPI00399ADF86
MNLAPAIALLIAGIALSVSLPTLLLRLGHSPRAALACWQLATATVLGSWVLAGLSIGDLIFQPLHRLGHRFSICIAALQGLTHDTRHDSPTTIFGGAASAALVVWIGVWITARLLRDRRVRARHAADLRMVARRDPDAGIYIVDSALPAVYCCPGPEHIVVASTSALAELSRAELAAVLAHERAHLAHRDHLRISVARALARAFPFVPLFAVASDEIARLCELRADDVAARAHGRRTVASALLQLLAARTPAPGIGAGGTGGAARVRRLLETPSSVASTLRGAALLGVAVATAALPLVAVGLALTALPYSVALCDLH